MASVKLGIGLKDDMTKEISKINRQVTKMQKTLDKAQISADGLSNVNLRTMTKGLGNVEAGAGRLEDQLNQVEDRTRKISDGFSGWQKAIIVANQAISLFKAGANLVGNVLGISDTYMQTNARLSLINDGLRTNKDLQKQIFESAERSRSSYEDTASTISKIGLLAGEAFKGNDELIEFTELINKSAKVSGTSPEEMSGAMRQLTQGLSSGALRGDEFVSVSENLPMVKNAIAEYLGVSSGALREIAGEGKITADVVKEAMFASSDKINEMFKTMPVTFGDSMTSFKNIMNQTVGEVGTRILPKIQQFLAELTVFFSSPEFQAFATGMAISLMEIANLLMWLFGIVSNVFNFVINNWPMISQILSSIALVLLPALIGAMLKWVALNVKNAAVMLWSWLTGLSPIMLVVMAIMAVIAILKLLGVSFETVFSFIGGVVGVTVGVIMNIFIGLYNGIATIINGIAYGFEVVVWGIRTGIAGAVNFVLDQVLTAAKIIDAVFGSDLADKVSNMQDNMKKWAGEMPEFKEIVKTQDYVDLEDAWNKGSTIGKSLGAGLDGLLDKAGNIFKGLDAVSDIGGDSFGAGIPVNVTGGSLDSSGKVDISEEDLKMLKDIASREFMIKYNRVVPTMSVSFGDVRETADVEEIKKAIEKMTQEELANMYLEEVVVQ